MLGEERQTLPQLNWLLQEHWKRKRRVLARQKEGNLDEMETFKRVIDVFRTPKRVQVSMDSRRRRRCGSRDNSIVQQIETLRGNLKLNCSRSYTMTMRDKCPRRVSKGNSQNKDHYNADKVPTRRIRSAFLLITFTLSLLASSAVSLSKSQSLIQSDPRPTIYSGQVSFGLLLSAHSSTSAELSTSASQDQVNLVYPVGGMVATNGEEDGLSSSLTTTMSTSRVGVEFGDLSQPSSLSTTTTNGNYSSTIQSATSESMPSVSNSSSLSNQNQLEDIMVTSENTRRVHHHDKRQIFERNHRQNYRRQRQHQQSNTKQLAQQQLEANGVCSQINTNALYAGMGAIWASHQANLVGDSHLAIGTYVYDSCNDLDVGQRQSVRIVSNLNAFQQTTCEAPRGSPISLTIAHGDNQLRAIQLLTSFKVPVITTKEHFALEDYNQLSRDQRRFLFSTAPSSRHLAFGALRFSKSIVARSTNSPKLPNNRERKMSARNGLIVISSNLPTRFISHLTELIPRHVNYVMHQSFQPIEQIKSVEALESIFIKQDSGSSSSETRLNKVSVPFEGAAGSGARPEKEALAGEGSEEEEQVGAEVPREQVVDGNTRRRRNADSAEESGESEFQPDAESAKMLSPTILMFITRSEAIDLVTRLRNDLAEVSKYYSLIVTTREDISPALKTIFYSGGSRLCPGKAFYTISPKPDDIGEFNRYFRDTVQMEGETSDHPLICEFAKYQASSRKNIDLDDISTESVIKAVWSAAAAFKSVHKQQCSSSSPSSSSSSLINQSDGTSRNSRQSSPSASSSATAGGSQASGSSASGGKNECMVKMNKNMSTLVQRALTRLDVTINSTGLQALDGFRLRFDDLNELITNRFSIKYINKECEITELGHFSGLGQSKLKLDEETLIKSIESTLPDPWPVHLPPSTPAPALSASLSTASSPPDSSHTGSSSSAGAETTTQTSGPDGSSADGGGAESNFPGAGKTRGRRKNKSSNGDQGAESAGESNPSRGDDDNDSDKSGSASDEAPRLAIARKHHRASESAYKEQSTRKQSGPKRRPVNTVTALNGRGLPGMTDESSSTGNEAAATTSANVSAKQTRLLRTQQHSSDWFPTTLVSPAHSGAPNFISGLLNNQNERKTTELAGRATTQAPVFSTLPESGGNADLEPTIRVPKSINSTASPVGGLSSLDTSATSESSLTDYVTSPSIAKNSYNTLVSRGDYQSTTSGALDRPGSSSQPRRTSNPSAAPNQPTGSYLRDILPSSSPIPLWSSMANSYRSAEVAASSEAQQQYQGRSRLRSHLKWIYSSWFTLCILCLNICGALVTLYVLTFLLMKNCDGSLKRENQGLRSLHLLAIIMVFFGSILFIVYPTPSLCLLRSSWYNFALVMLFGSLLLQTMQLRSLKSIGLGGRPNRLNQFLTLLFIVGVQVSFELQRWKYESANYIKFVSQYLSSIEGSAGSEEKKLALLSSALANQLNPFSSFNDQVPPISVQVSEQYQSLLQDYCVQQPDDFLQSQLYLCAIVFLLIVFSFTVRNFKRPSKSSKSLETSIGKHGSHISTSQFQFSSNVHNQNSQSSSRNSAAGFESSANIFSVTLIITPIYSVSLLIHLYGQNAINRDIVSSITMVLIAFTTLIGIFLPILKRIHDSPRTRVSAPDDSTESSSASSNRTSIMPIMPVGGLTKKFASAGEGQTFAMFPEFAPTGLRRPSSGTCDSGSGSRRAFAETKESRRNMSVALANLGPSEDSLRSMGFYNSDHNHNYRHSANNNKTIESNLTTNNNLKGLNVNSAIHAEDPYRSSQQLIGHPKGGRTSKGEKRLIMLDVDPCCPKHGIAAMSSSNSK